MSLMPREFSFATPSDLGGMANYQLFCRIADLEPIDGGWAFLHCVDETGKRITAVTSDISYQQMLVTAAATPDALASLEIPATKYPMKCDGWPDEWVQPEQCNH